MGSVPDATPTPRLLCGEAKSKTYVSQASLSTPHGSKYWQRFAQALEKRELRKRICELRAEAATNQRAEDPSNKDEQESKAEVTGSGFEILNLRIGTTAVQVRSGQARAPMASPFDGAGAKREKNKFPNCYPHAAKMNNGQRSTLYPHWAACFKHEEKL